MSARAVAVGAALVLWGCGPSPQERADAIAACEASIEYNSGGVREAIVDLGALVDESEGDAFRFRYPEAKFEFTPPMFTPGNSGASATGEVLCRGSYRARRLDHVSVDALPRDIGDGQEF